jgi:hypothetical protein
VLDCSIDGELPQPVASSILMLNHAKGANDADGAHRVEVAPTR